MDTLIGREPEIRLLKEYTTSGHAEFVAIYGRRRVGKTFLVKSLFENSLAFSMTGIINGKMSEQMEAFVDALLDFSGNAVEKPRTWMEAFRQLKLHLKSEVKKNKPCVLFFDEVSSMDTQRSGFLRALGYFWNSWASMQSNLTLIVCSSATSWMIKHVINDKGGLHDRVTHEIHLHPFTLKETEQYLISRNFQWDRMSILKTYMSLGGIPYYFGMLRSNESFAMNIDRLFFSENEELRREYRRLYSTLFDSPDSYIAIVGELAKMRSGLTRDELCSKLKIQSSGTLSDKLEDLVNCDIIRKYPVREKKIKTTSAIYQLTDFYSLFYHIFIPKAEAETNYWTNHIGTPEVNTWCGLCFEKVCMAHVNQIRQALHIDRIATKFYSWRSKGESPKAQIDMVLERADGVSNIVEIKFSETEYAQQNDESLKLRRRINLFRQQTGAKETLWPTLITTYGLKEGMHSDDFVSVLTLDDLFA